MGMYKMATDMNDYFNKKKKTGGDSGGGSNFPPKGPKAPNIDFNFKGSGFLYFIIGLVVLLMLAKPFTIVEEGQRGILSTNGKYEANALLPGLHFIIPVIQKVYLVDTKVRIINYADRIDRSSATGEGLTVKPAITVLDKRGLPVGIELTVQYRLNATNAAQTISNWGFSWEEKIINPVVRDIVRNVIGQYDAESLPQKRNEIANAIDLGIRQSVDKQANTPANLESVQLREIILPQKVKDQIERVQLAKQQVEQAQQEVEKAKQEAFKREETERGKANAIEIAAKGKAKAIEIEAKANAQANKIIAASLTKQLLELEQMKVQNKFNEALSTNKDAKIFLTPGGSTPNIWVDMKNKQQRTTAK
jgi:regulator of protease activity HflC (stomatin/prohibitin superfamily)